MSGQELANVSERRAQLASQYSDPPSQVSAKMPEIRLSVHMSKKAVPKGHFFIVDRNVPDGDEPTVTDIGDELQCIVLRSCMKMSAFDGDNNKSLAETTEFSDFQNEPIFVIDNAGERPCIATVAPYGTIKQMKYEPTKEELKAYRDSGGAAGKTTHPLYPILKDLKLQYIAYVLYKAPGMDEPGIFLLKLGARGYLGMNAQGEACRYGEEADTSFIKARSKCHKQYPRTTHMHIWKVFSSSFKTGEKDEDANPIVDYYPSFDILGEWDDSLLEAVEQGRDLLKQFLLSQYGRRVGFAWRNTSDREFIPRQVSEMLDATGGQDEVAALLLGEKRLASAAKSQLTIGGGSEIAPAAPRASAPTLPAPASRKSSQQAVNEVADALGGADDDEPEPVKPEPAPAKVAKKKESPLKGLFAGSKKKVVDEAPSKDPEEMAASAKRNVDALSAKPQSVDPKAPGYIPPGWLSDEEKKKIPQPAGGTEAAPTAEKVPVNKIPKGW